MKDVIIALVIVIANLATFFTIIWVGIRTIDKKPIFSWKEPGKQYISYKTYRRLSAIAPDRWKTIDDWCLYVLYSHREEGSKRLYMDSPISVIQLWIHIHKKEKNDDRYRDSKEMEELIKSWKMDLDEFNRREENESSGNHNI